MTFSQAIIRSSATAAAVATLGFAALPAQAEVDGAQLKLEAEQTLNECATVEESCAELVDSAAGVLVFPEVLKADLIVGGAGGNGILFVDDEVEGYYDIGKASVGLQAGVDEAAVVYVFRDQDSLNELIDNQKWEIGTAAGATVVRADAEAMATSGDPVVYVFDADGLNAELDVNALRIWQDPENAS